MARPLAPRQERFCLEYLIDLNGTDAYKRAGYKVKSDKVAGAAAARLLADVRVQARIEELKKEREQRTAVTADRVVEEFAVLGFSSVWHYVMDDDGNLALAPGAPESAKRAVRSIKRKTRWIPQGGGPPIKEVTCEFTLWDKPGSLFRLAQHTGAIDEKGSAPQVLVIELVRDGRVAARREVEQPTGPRLVKAG